VAAAIAGQFSATVGLLMLKRSSATEAEKPWFKRTYFWLGLFFVLSNGCGVDWIAFMFAPLTLIAPFGCLTIVFSNTLAAFGVLVEKEGMPGPCAISANLIIIVGIVLAGIYGPHDSKTHTIQEMVKDAYQPQFLEFLVPSLTIVVFYMVARCFWKPGVARGLRCIWAALASALCAAVSQTSLKIVAEALRLTINGENEFVFAGTYLAATGVIIAAPLNVRLLDEALSYVLESSPPYSSRREDECLSNLVC
jgi:hypothetical protein